MADSITAALGVLGWRRLDAVILAALATEAPLLLIGEHGTAKSLLVERIADALGLAFRHYNASLLNYDDLVGIPLPEGDSLRFVGTPGSIWGAEFAFFDEISRCRPELQNKLFPIVHERKVAGIALDRLRFRWGAMNPPAALDGEVTAATYIGSEALDPALADRFAFIVRAPAWKDLGSADRLALVTGSVPKRAGTDLTELVARCVTTTAAVEAEHRARIGAYVVTLVDLLASKDIRVSPRRARVLARAVAGIHAARLETDPAVLGKGASELAASAELALQNGLPQNAEEAPPARLTLLAVHKQAWEVSGLDDSEPLKKVLAETDPLRRIALGDRLGLTDGELSRLVTQGLAAQPTDARRIAVGTALFLGFRERRDLTAAAWEPLGRLARRVIEPHAGGTSVETGPQLERWREINAQIAGGERDGSVSTVERNYLLAGFPDLWDRADWREALDAFRADLAAFAPTFAGGSGRAVAEREQ